MDRLQRTETWPVCVVMPNVGHKVPCTISAWLRAQSPIIVLLLWSANELADYDYSVRLECVWDASVSPAH